MTVGVIDHGYPEDGKTIFQDIGASKAPQSDCSSRSCRLPIGLLCLAGCRLRQPAGCRLQPDTDETVVPEHCSRVTPAIMYSVTCPLALFMK